MLLNIVLATAGIEHVLKRTDGRLSNRTDNRNNA